MLSLTPGTLTRLATDFQLCSTTGYRLKVSEPSRKLRTCELPSTLLSPGNLLYQIHTSLTAELSTKTNPLHPTLSSQRTFFQNFIFVVNNALFLFSSFLFSSINTKYDNQTTEQEWNINIMC
jgi:hypothetical protein